MRQAVTAIRVVLVFLAVIALSARQCPAEQKIEMQASAKAPVEITAVPILRLVQSSDGPNGRLAD